MPSDDEPIAPAARRLAASLSLSVNDLPEALWILRRAVAADLRAMAETESPDVAVRLRALANDLEAGQ